MKKLLLLSVLLFLGMVYCFGQNKITQKQAIDIVNKHVVVEKDYNIYISKKLISPSESIETMNGIIKSPNYFSWFIFIDEHPFQNWWHDCKYIFINSTDGNIKVINMKYPPNLLEMDVVQEKKVKKGILFDINELKKQTTKSTSSMENNWAVIISGGGSKYSNHERYWNDCSAIYSSLIHIYGYRKDRIKVLISDGTNPDSDRLLINGGYDSSPLDLDGDGLPDIEYAATKNNLKAVFNNLGQTLSDKDNLFIFTTDHGGSIGGNSTMVLWNNEIIYDYEFSNLLNSIKANTINIVMEQCYSGGFIDDLKKDSRVIATACKSDEVSYATSDRTYNEFVYHWISAVTGKMPNGTKVNADTNNDGIISMSEAFNYARSKDKEKETPQYSSTPINLGEILSLKDIHYLSSHFKILNLSSILCSNNIGDFQLNIVPKGSTITWSGIQNMTLVSGQGTKTATFKASGNGYAKVKATINYNGENYTAENSYVWVGAPPKPTGILGIPSTGIQTNSIYNLTVKDFAHPGVEKFHWNSLANDGKPGYSRLVANNYMATLYTGSNNNQLAIMLSVRAENKCGNSAFYILPVTGSGSGISPFMLKSNNPLDEDLYDIKIYNFSTGQIVYQEKKAVNFSIESTTLKSGIYIVESTDENGNITRTKVMKK